MAGRGVGVGGLFGLLGENEGVDLVVEDLKEFG
jgi:hypothetical protein